MQYAHFEDRLRKIHATHGKNYPPPQAAAAIWKRVADLPDAFMDYALAASEEYERLPANLGRDLRRVLWPEYLEKYPLLKARHSPQGCDDCLGGRAGPGWIYAWTTDGRPRICKCACNPARPGEQGWTREAIARAGLLLHAPVCADRP